MLDEDDGVGLSDYSEDELRIAEELFSEHYDALGRIARANRRRSRMKDTMQTSDILHETFFRLRDHHDWVSGSHFLNAATLAIRQVIIDHARKRNAVKRGAGSAHVPIEDVEAFLPEFNETPEEVLAIADILDKVKARNPRWIRIVDARYFSGMTEEETAANLGLSVRTVRRDWRAARDFIARTLDA
ncbi:MAG: ECF-type sigma factor [Pseudomonadota bacterium]